jgi:hypothetical protein
MSFEAELEMVYDMSPSNILRKHVFVKFMATSRLHTARLIFHNQLCIVEVSTMCNNLVNQYNQVTTYGFRNTKDAWRYPDQPIPGIPAVEEANHTCLRNGALLLDEG